MRTKPTVFCVISHTHWDREWYAPLEVFRHRLVDLFDRLLLILKENPGYVFHLDAQTVVLEDYLEVRPSKKKELTEWIQKGNIVIGPWYLQNDFYLTSGEATIRNLLEGAKLCEEFGGKGQVGYAPDQFGNISQLPQILRNFNLDNFVFGRGFSEYTLDEHGGFVRKSSPTEFIWEGADGSRVLAIHMRHWYNNAQRFSPNAEKSFRYLKSIEATFDNEYTFTPYYLLMNGVDHLEPQGDLLPILDKLNQKLEDGSRIQQYNFDKYLQQVKEYLIKEKVELSVHKGELRNGHDRDILKGTLSSRHYLKVANVKAQSFLENRLEPLYAMLEQFGVKGVASVDHFRYLWKNLLRNHPHDSICGCSRDEVHAHMENRYNEFFEFANEYLKRGLQVAADHTALCQKGKSDEYVLSVFNTLSVPLSGNVKVTMNFIAADGFEDFEIYDENNALVPFMVYDRVYEEYDVYSPINLPGVLDVVRYEGYVDVGEVAPYAIKTFTIRKKEGTRQLSSLLQNESYTLQNEFFSVDINKKGQVALRWGGNTAENCLYLEDVADVGDSYTFLSANDMPIYSHQYVTGVEVKEHHEFCQSVAITYELPLPVDYNYKGMLRSEETEITKVVITLSVKPHQPFVQVDYHVENQSKWHRLRVVVDTGVSSSVSTADIPFDVVTHGEETHCVKTDSKVLPNSSFAYLENNEKGFAVLTQGAHEYEHLNNSCLAFTIVRATGGINKSSTKQWQTPEGQCIRTIEGSMALAPFNDVVNGVTISNVSLQFRAPLLGFVTCCDPKRFTGGRPCVQDTELTEQFYLPDLYSHVSIPSNVSAFTVEGEGITVTACKQSEDGEKQVIRLVNLTQENRCATICANAEISVTDMAEIKCNSTCEKQMSFSVKPKEIITLFLG